MTMTKASIVNDVYERVGVTKKEAADYVEAVFETMKETLANGEDVKISGFGKFEVRQKGNRIGRNPRTGVEIMIPERKVPRFKVSQVLKDELNDPRSRTSDGETASESLSSVLPKSLLSEFSNN